MIEGMDNEVNKGAEYDDVKSTLYGYAYEMLEALEGG